MCFAAATREAKESKKIDKQLKGDKKNVCTILPHIHFPKGTHQDLAIGDWKHRQK